MTDNDHPDTEEGLLWTWVDSPISPSLPSALRERIGAAIVDNDLVATQDALHELLRDEVRSGALSEYHLNVLGTQDGRVRSVEVRAIRPIAGEFVEVTVLPTGNELRDVFARQLSPDLLEQIDDVLAHDERFISDVGHHVADKILDLPQMQDIKRLLNEFAEHAARVGMEKNKEKYFEARLLDAPTIAWLLS